VSDGSPCLRQQRATFADDAHHVRALEAGGPIRELPVGLVD